MIDDKTIMMPVPTFLPSLESMVYLLLRIFVGRGFLPSVEGNIDGECKEILLFGGKIVKIM
jgi:hypothetical protein